MRCVVYVSSARAPGHAAPIALARDCAELLPSLLRSVLCLGHAKKTSETSVKIIREAVDSLCRDGVDMPRPPYIGKASTLPNIESFLGR